MNKKIILPTFVVAVIGTATVITFDLFSNGAENTTNHMDALLARVTPEELINQSDGIVLGTVQDLQVNKIPSDLRPDEEDIVTSATIRVENYLHNPHNLTYPEVIVQVIGGSIGNDTMIAEDAASFKENQRVVIFLKQKHENTFTVYGWVQGKYTLDENNVVGIGDERTYFENVFGREMTLNDLEIEISLVSSDPRTGN